MTVMAVRPLKSETTVQLPADAAVQRGAKTGGECTGKEKYKESEEGDKMKILFCKFNIDSHGLSPEKQR